MSHAIRGLVAVTAVVLAGFPVASSAASASVTSVRASAANVAANIQDIDEDWGPYYSGKKNGKRAKASGSVYDLNDVLHVKGKIWDKHSSASICGYAQTKFVNEDDDTKLFSRLACNNASTSFDHSWNNEDISAAYVRVCFWDLTDGERFKCSSWNEVYNGADGDEEEEEDE